MKKIDADEIFRQTDGGRTIIEALYPQSREAFSNPKKKFSIRAEKTPSCALKQYNGIWFLTDFGEQGKGKNAIQLFMQVESCTFPEACARIAAQYNLGGILKEDINKPRIDTVPARHEQEEGTRFFKIKDFTEAEMACMGPLVKKEHLQALHWHSLEYIAMVKDRKVIYKYTTPNYFIFIRECTFKNERGESDTFYKIYEPLNAEKRWRFSYYPNGKKPSEYINGLPELQDYYAKINKGNIDGEPDHKLEKVFICSGERDSICVRSLGYQPVWFNSETHDVSYKEILTLLKYAEQVYNIPDIDTTGIERGKELALKFPEIKTIWLPDSLRRFRDNRGRARKDFRDWIELHQSPAAFRDLITLALSAKFWNEVIKNNQIEYTINSICTLYFLRLNGFYTLKDENSDITQFVRIQGAIVSKVTGKEIRAFIRTWAEHHALPEALRNKILDNKKMTDACLEALPQVDPDFSSADSQRQLFFFPNQSVEVSANGVNIFHGKDASELQHFVWEQNIIKHHFELLPDFFTITHTLDERGDYKFDIQISDTSSHVLCYLINASRIYWQKEMEDRFGNDTDAINKYGAANRFRIDGEGLSPQEIYEQKQNLINKLHTIGYMFYRFKEMSRPMAPLCLDYKIGENNQSNGGSGKSFLFVFFQQFLKVVKLSGRDPKLLDNTHVFDQVNKNTDILLLDDCYRGMPMGRFYDMISSDMVINPKNQQSFTLPYSQSPKFAFTSNYVPSDFDPSSERRMIYVNYSDYYHVRTPENTYRQTRTIRDDFNKDLFGHEYTEEEWNADINLIIQCTKFYLSARSLVYKINPPMHNIVVRKLRSDIGENFLEWASEKFADWDNNPYLDIPVRKQLLFENYRAYSNISKLTATAFKRKLRAFCEYSQWIDTLNPPEMCNSKPDRIMYKGADGRVEEYIYVRSRRKADELKALKKENSALLYGQEHSNIE